MSLLVGDQNRNAWQTGEKIDVQTMGVRGLYQSEEFEYLSVFSLFVVNRRMSVLMGRGTFVLILAVIKSVPKLTN